MEELSPAFTSLPAHSACGDVRGNCGQRVRGMPTFYALLASCARSWTALSTRQRTPFNYGHLEYRHQSCPGSLSRSYDSQGSTSDDNVSQIHSGYVEVDLTNPLVN